MVKTDQGRGTARVSLHRFGRCAGLSVLNASGTVYLDAKAARALAREMARLARSLERESFTSHTFKGEGVPAFASSVDAARASADWKGGRNGA